MSTVDERVVILEFNNAQFETNVKQSVSTLQKLKDSLNLEGSAKGLDQLNKSAKSFSLNHVADNIQTVADRFSALGIVGDQVLRRLTDKAIDLGKSLITAIPNQIISGGKRRAQNIEQAKFMLEGLLGEAYDWEKIQEDINYAVSGTAYGFDEAASAAGQLAASSVEFGDDMKAALRGISGVAAMTNDEYSTIAQIFTKIAGQGKVMTQELNQLAAHGINAAATLADVFEVTEGEIREMVHDGEVDFKMFSYAMDAAFGEHAKNANATFQGVLRNVKASLSRMGEQFATPAYDNLRLILVALLPVMKDIEQFIKPISAGFKGFAESISGAVVPALESLHYWFAGIRGLQQDYDFSDVITTWAKKLNGMTREQAQELGLFDQFLDAIATKEQEIKDSLTDEDGKTTFYDSTLLEKDKNAFVGAIEEIVDATKEGGKMDFNPLLNALDAATETADTLDKVEKSTETVEKAVKSVDEANKKAEDSAKETQKEYKKTSKYAKSFSNVQESVANSTKKAYSELEQHGTLGKLASNMLKKLTREEQKRAQAQADLSTEGARNEKIAIEMSERSAAAAKKDNLFQRVRNKIFQGATGAFGKAAQAAANFLGFNQETVKALASEEQMQQVIDDLANRTWMGEFGNGEDRVKALGELGAAYSIVQNRVNELLNCEKRHTVTAEDEAKMMEYVCKTLGISSAEGKRVTTIIDALTKIFAGLISALEVIKIFGLAIFTEIIQPFAKFAFQTILAAILPPLGAIGDALADFYSKLNPEDVTKFFSDVRESVVAFWNKVQELEGVKKLKEAWDTFKSVLDDFRKKVVEKLTTKFEELRKNFKLPEGSFFLNIIDNITNGLSHLVDILSVGVISIGEFFSPLVDWITSIPGKLKEFWDLLWNKEEGEEAGEGFNIFSGVLRNFSDSVNEFIDSIAPLKAVKDFLVGFWNSIFGKKEKKTTFGKMFDEASKKTDILKKAWSEGQNPFAIMISPFEELKKRVDEFTDSIAPLKAVKDWMKDFWNTIFGKPGEGEDPEKYGFGAAFDKLKQQISDFMDSVPILKTVKDWFTSIFNENLAKSISEIGKAISDFFKALFDKQEEGEGTPLPFGERFIQAAERLKERIIKVFGAGPELGKLLMTGGGLGAGILGIVKLISSLKGNQNGGIAGAIFGSARGGVAKAPAIIGALLAISAALNMFGVQFKKTTEDGEKNILFIEFIWDKLLAFLGNTAESIKSLDIGGKIYEFLFGKENKKAKEETNGLVDNVKGTLQTVADTIRNTVGLLFGDKNGSLGLGGAAGIIAAIAGIYVLITAFRALGKALAGMFSIFTGAAGILADLRVALSAYTDNLRANTFLSFAKAFGIFALGIAALAMVPPENLAASLGAITWLAVLLGLLIVVFNKFTKVNTFSDAVSAANTVVLTFVRSLAAAFRTAATMAGIGLLFTGIAAAVLILVGAINKLAHMDNLNEAMSAFQQIMVILAGMVAIGAMLTMSPMPIGPAILTIGAAFIELAIACNIFSKIDGEKISKNANVILAGIVVLVGVAEYLNSGVFNFANWKIGAQFALIAGGLILFAAACKSLQGIQWEAIAWGIGAMAVAIVSLGIASRVAGGGTIGGGGALAGLALSLLALAYASVIIGKNIVYAVGGIAALSVALYGFAVISNMVLPAANVALTTFTTSLWRAGLGVLALAVSLPVLGYACQMFGEILWGNFLNTVTGLAAFVGVVLLLGVVSGITSPSIIALGQAMMFLAIAINLIVGAFTDFKGIRSLIGEIAGGIGDIFGSFLSIPASILGAFTRTSKAVKDSGNDYVTAADSYKKALNGISGLSETARTELAAKLEELKYVDGSEFSMTVHDIVTYITRLNIDEESKRQAINASLRAAEQQQSENFTLTVWDIEVTLRNHGATSAQVESVMAQLQDAFNKSPGALTAKIISVHSLIDTLNIPKKDQTAIKTAVDNAIKSQITFQASIKSLKAIIDDSTGVTSDDKEALKAKVDELISGWSYEAHLDKINVWLKASGLDINNQFGVQTAINKALEFKTAFDVSIGALQATLAENVPVDVDRDMVMTKVNEALNAVVENAENGASEQEVAAELKNVKAVIADLYPQIDWEDGVETALETELNAAFDKIMENYEGYHVELNKIKMIIDSSNLTKEQKAAFGELQKALFSQSNPLDIGKLWIQCKDLGMSTTEMAAFLEQLGVTLNEATKKEILLSGVKVTMGDAGLTKAEQLEVEKELNALGDYLAELSEKDLLDAEKYSEAKQKAIDQIIEITGDENLARQLVGNYLTEAGDMKNASLAVVEGMINTMMFGTAAEQQGFKERVQGMYDLYGQPLKDAWDAFIADIKEHSSLSDEDISQLEEQGEKVVEAQTRGLNEGYRQQLDAEAAWRRRQNIGAFAVNVKDGSSTIGGSIADNSSVAKVAKGLLDKDKNKDLDRQEYMKFLEDYNKLAEEEKLTWEDFVSSFQNTGMTDDELRKLFFTDGSNKVNFTEEGYRFMKDYFDSYMTGASQAYKDDMARYGNLNWASLLEKVIADESSEASTKITQGMFYTPTPALYSALDRQFNDVTDKIRDYLGKKEGEKVTIDEFYNWYFGENKGNQTFIDEAPYLTNFMEVLHAQIQELVASGKSETDAMKEVFGAINSTLYASGDGINRAAGKASVEIRNAYRELIKSAKDEGAVEELMAGLKQVFDSENLFTDDALFYDFMSNAIFGNSVFGTDEIKSLEEMITEGMDIDGVMDAVLGAIAGKISNEQMSQETLIKLYKQFPELRKKLQTYLEENGISVPEEFKTKNIDEVLKDQKDAYQAAMKEIADDTSVDHANSQEAIGKIQEMIFGGELTQAEAVKWAKEMNLDFGEIFGNLIGTDLSSMDTTGVVGSLWTALSGMQPDVEDKASELGKWFDQGLANGALNNLGLLTGSGASAFNAIYDETFKAGAYGSPSKKSEKLGFWYVMGFGLGISRNKDKATHPVITMFTACLNAVKDRVSLFATQGSNASLAYGSGISSRLFYVFLAGVGVVNQAIAGLKSLEYRAKELGGYFADGYAQGVASPEKLEAARSAGAELAKAAKEGNETEQASGSPSKVAMHLGNYFGEGYVIGMQQFGTKVHNAGAELASTAIDTLRNPLQIVQDYLSSDLDYDPTIRPVMDISGIQNGVKTINGMMPNTRVGLDFISNSMNRVKTTNEDVVSAITGLSKQMEGVKGGDSYTVNGVTYDDGSNISTAVKSLIHATKIERRA